MRTAFLLLASLTLAPAAWPAVWPAVRPAVRPAVQPGAQPASLRTLPPAARRQLPQQAPPQEQDPSIDTGQRVVASVNGEPITAADLEFHAWLRAGASARQLDARSLAILRRQLAEQVLMATEADRLGVTITESYILDFWESYNDGPPDYAQMAEMAGVTEERSRWLVKRSVLSDIYLYHRVGIWAEFGHLIKPDPVFSHAVEVTPKELRDLFREEREYFDIPATVTYQFYPCADRATADGVVEALSVGLVPSSVRPGQETAPLAVVPEVFAFSSDLVAFLQSAEPGAVSPAFDASVDQNQVGWVVFVIDGRDAGRPAQFAEVQEELRRRMRMSRLEVAREQLLRDLVRQAVYWPRDLFDDDPVEPPSAGGRGAAATIRKDG